MSGHSHWATIKHKKGATDAKRGKLWSKLSRAIIIAARQGGGGPGPAEGRDEDALMEKVLEAGADDLRRTGASFEVVCDPHAFNKVQEALKAAGLNVTNSELAQTPKVPVDADAEAARKVLR